MAYVDLAAGGFGSLVLGVVVFLITRSLDSARPCTCGFSMVTMTVLCVVLVGVCLMASRDNTVHALLRGEFRETFVVLSAFPLGVFVAVGALLGWRLAELQ